MEKITIKFASRRSADYQVTSEAVELVVKQLLSQANFLAVDVGEAPKETHIVNMSNVEEIIFSSSAEG